MLPREYQQVEYLQFNGNQWIVTNVQNADNQVINFKFSIDSRSRYNRLYGVRINNVIYTTFIVLSQTDTRGIYYSKNNTAAALAGRQPNFLPNTVYDVTVNAGTTINVNGVDYVNQGTYGGASVSGYYYIGNQQNNEDPDLFQGKLYNFSITQSGDIIIELIPCYRKSDNVAGMYDKVSKTFFTNAGTGSFAVGPEV